MPLMHGKSSKAFEKNIKTEMHAGKPQDQALAIAYNVKRHATRKKMASGGVAEGDTLGSKINYPKGPSLAQGGHVHNSMCMSKGGSCYAEGGMVDEQDRARGYDESVLKEYPADENEDLTPNKEPEHGAEKMMNKTQDFGYKAQNYEDLPHPMEPKEERKPAPENLPNNMDVEDVPSHMFAKGGIAKAIMMKHMKMMPEKMAMGGSVWDEAMDDQGGVYGGSRFEHDKDHEEEMDAYAHGGRVDWDESIDNQYPDEHPDNDYLSDEEQTPYFHYNDMDALEPTEKRRNMISKIMRSLHERNR